MTSMLAPAAQPDSADERTLYITFRLADLFFGIDVSRVQEVNRDQQMTQVPLAPDTIRGLINLRGQIVTAVDLRRRMALPPHADDFHPMSIVVRSSEELVTLIVDEIGEVLELSAGGFEGVPPTLGALEQGVLTSVYKLEDKLLLILDTDKAITAGAPGEQP